jgi:hypothetical protein
MDVEKRDNGRELLAEISANLVESIDLRKTSKWKLPGKVQTIRESLLWRLEELAQNAFQTLDADRFVASALNVRAIMETTAALIFLHSMMQKAIDNGVSEAIITKVDKFLINSKIWDELEDPIHINDMLRAVEKVIPGFFGVHYAALCEWAHPNWGGTFGAFGAFDDVNFLAVFRKGGRSPDVQRKKISSILAASLGLAKGYYEIIGKDLDAFVNAVEVYYTKNPPQGDELRQR